MIEKSLDVYAFSSCLHYEDPALNKHFEEQGDILYKVGTNQIGNDGYIF